MDMGYKTKYFRLRHPEVRVCTVIPHCQYLPVSSLPHPMNHILTVRTLKKNNITGKNPTTAFPDSDLIAHIPDQRVHAAAMKRYNYRNVQP